MKERALNILIALDQFIWVLFTFGKGYPDETISAAIFRMEQENKLAGKLLRPLIDSIFFFDINHCRNSYASEISRRQLPEEYSKGNIK